MERYLFRKIVLAGVVFLGINGLVKASDNSGDISYRLAMEYNVNKNTNLKEEAGIIEENSASSGEENSISNETDTNDTFYQKELNKIIDRTVLNLITTPLISEKTRESVKMLNIPIIVNKFVEKQYYYFLRGNKDFLIKSLNRAKPFIDEIKQTLREKKLPEELAYLPLIESGFNCNAISRKGATGMWQFMPGTAKWIGMNMNLWYDERYDPIISCEYAAHYFELMYKDFGDWYMALAAYNHGGRNLMKDMKKGKSNSFYDLVKKKAMPKETSLYVPRYIAGIQVIRNLEKYGVDYKEEKTEFIYYKLPFMSPVHLVAKHAGMSNDLFVKLNPALRAGFVPAPEYHFFIRIPEQNYQTLVDNLDKLKEATKYSYMPYYIKKGDTLSELAQRFGVPQAILMNINNLHNAHKLKIGQRIFIPMKKLVD